MPEQDPTAGTDWSENAPAPIIHAEQPAPAPDGQAYDPALNPPTPGDPAPAVQLDPAAAPTRVLEEPAQPQLPPNPMASLRQVFRDVASAVGQGKAEFILVEFYGVTTPDELCAADLLDAIDKLYEAA